MKFDKWQKKITECDDFDDCLNILKTLVFDRDLTTYESERLKLQASEKMVELIEQ